MSDNIRFGVIVAVVVAVVGLVLWAVLGGDVEAPSDEPVSTPRVADDAEESSWGAYEEPVREIEEPGDAAPPSRVAARPDRRPRTQRPSGNGVIRGEVVWRSDKKPAAGADVVVELQDWPRTTNLPPHETVTWTTSTESDGTFRLTRMPTAGLYSGEGKRYAVMATKDGAFGLASAVLTSDEVDGYVSVAIEEVGAIAGHVIDASKAPVVGAFVFPDQGENDRYVDGASLRAVTDDSGAFNVANLPRGKWKLTVRAEGYAVKTTDLIGVDTDDVEIVVTEGGTLAGTVVEAQSGGPVPDAELLISSGRWNNHTVTSDAKGAFTVAGLADGRYQIALQESEYVVVGESPVVEISGEKSLTDKKIPVAMGGVITGRAYDADTQEPLVGVQFRSMSQGRGGNPEGVSGPDGYYRIAGLNEGTYTIRRRWFPGYMHGESREDKTVSVNLGQQIDNIDFPVKKGLYLRGVVVDAKGTPLDRVRVTSSDTVGRDEGESTTTKEDGRFEHRGFSPNTPITIHAQNERYTAEPIQNLTIGEEDLNDIKIVMEPGASIAGVVVDKSGKPMTDVYVNARPTLGGGGGGTSTNQEGQFTVSGLAAGTYSMMLQRRSSGYRPETRAGDPITLAKAQSLTGVRLVFSEETGLTISGRITNSKREPIKDAYVNVHSRNGGSNGYAQSDADGRYEITGLQEGVHMLNAGHNEYSYARLEEVAAGSKNVDLVLDDHASIEGRVVDDRGRPLRTFQVGYFNGNSDRIHPSMFQNMTTFFDDGGVFSLKRVNAGDVTVFAKAEGLAPALSFVPNVMPGKTVTGVEIRLQAGASVEGLVVDERGVPVAGARVYPGEAPQDEWMRNNTPGTTTDANGRFTLTSLSPDTESIGALHNDYPPVNAPVELVPGRSVYVEIRLSQGGSIDGRVTVAGRPAQGQQVFCHNVSGGQSNHATTDPSGYYTISGLSEGDYNVTASMRLEGGGNRNSNQIAQVQMDMVTTVNFDFSPGDAAIEGVVTMGGRPMAEGHVAAMVGSGGSMEHIATQLGPDGSYRIEGVPAGTVSLNVGARMNDQWQSRTVQVEAVSRRTVRRDIDFQEGVRVSGTVSGQAENDMVVVIALRGSVEIPSISQSLWSRFGSLVAGQTQVAQDGAFEIQGIEPGEYTFVAVDIGNPREGRTQIDNAPFTTAVTTISGDNATVHLRLPN